MNAKCDYCDQRATTLAGDTNGVLVCEDHVRLFAEREIAAAIPDQITPGRIPPAWHEHDAAGCIECSCNAAPWSSKTPCTCPTPVPSEADPGTGERLGWCDAAPLFSGHDGGARPHPKAADCKAWRPVPDPADPLAWADQRGRSFRTVPATPDAGEAALAEDVVLWHTLAEIDARPGVNTYRKQARAVLASDWLASHDAATADRVRRETAEPLIVLDGLLRKWESNPAYRRGTAAAEVREALGEHLARVVREAGR